MPGGIQKKATPTKKTTGPGPKRTEIERQQARVRIADMMRRGFSYADMAKALNVHTSQVGYDVKIIMRELKERRCNDLEARRAQILDEYRGLKKELWEAWERSKKNAVERTEETTTAGKSGIRSLERKVRRGRLPSAVYLDLVERCIRAERELEGLDPAKEIKMGGVLTVWDAFAAAAKGGEIPDSVERRIREALGMTGTPKDGEVIDGDGLFLPEGGTEDGSAESGGGKEEDIPY